MIRPGTTNEVTLKSGKWVFIDIGFANKAKSCGPYSMMESQKK